MSQERINNEGLTNFNLLQGLMEDMNRRFTILEEAILRPPAPPQVPPPLVPPRPPNPPAAERQPQYRGHQYPDEYESDDQGEYRLHRQEYPRRAGWRRRSPYRNDDRNEDQRSERSFGPYRNQNQDELAHVRVKVPPFHGKNDPEIYLYCERKVDMIFYDQRCSEVSKVIFALPEFYDYALVWWDQMVLSRRNNCEPLIDT